MYHRATPPLPKRLNDDPPVDPDFHWSDLGWLLLGVFVLSLSAVGVIGGLWWLIGALA